MENGHEISEPFETSESPQAREEREENEEIHGRSKQRARAGIGYRAGGAILAVAFLTVAVLLLFPVHGEADVYDAVLRLHVLANSDDEEDQARKLLVRDAVVAAASERLVGCRTREEAENVMRASLDEIAQVATETLTGVGCDDPVTVLLGPEEYPTRQYETCCFPAGEYLSLRVCIGEAKGANWWCVLFPPLCLSAAKARSDTPDGAQSDRASETDPEEAFIAVGLMPEQYRIITETDRPKYKIRFRILEVIEDMFHK